MKFSRLVFGILFVSAGAFAAPSLTDLRAQKRCLPVKDKPNAFDCMVDQPDGAVKKVRYFQAFRSKRSKDESKAKSE